jgi:hypothetical protein
MPALVASALVAPIVCAAGVFIYVFFRAGLIGWSWTQPVFSLPHASWILMLQLTLGAVVIGIPIVFAVSWPAVILGLALIRRDYRLSIVCVITWFTACGAIIAHFIWRQFWGFAGPEMFLIGGVSGLISGGCFCVLTLTFVPEERMLQPEIPANAA